MTNPDYEMHLRPEEDYEMHFEDAGLKPEQTATVTPDYETQTVKPDPGCVFSEVTVEAIPEPTEEIDITENGTVDVARYGVANVAVPVGVFPEGTENISQNGDYDVKLKETAHVEVVPDLQDKTVTPTEQTQTIEADAGYDGLDTVTVNPIPPEYVVPSGSVEITANGQVSVAGKATANVSVPQGVFPAGTKLITQNVTGEDVTDYSAVDVAVPGPSGTKTLRSYGNYDVSDVASVSIPRWVRDPDAPNLDLLRQPGGELAHNSGYNVIFASVKIERVFPQVKISFKTNAITSIEDVKINDDGSYTVIKTLNITTMSINDFHELSAGWHVLRFVVAANATKVEWSTGNGHFDLGSTIYETYGRVPALLNPLWGYHIAYIDMAPQEKIVLATSRTNYIDFYDCDYSNATGVVIGSAAALKVADLHGLDFSSATSIAGMFTSCFSLEYVDLHGANFSNVTTMQGFFGGSTRYIDLHDIITGSLTSILVFMSYGYGIQYMDLRFDFNGANFSINQCRCPVIMFSDDCDVGTFTFGSESNGIRELIGFPHANDDVNVSSANSLSAEMLVHIMDQLREVSTTKTLNLGNTNKAKLTADQIAIAQDKGWTVA